MGAEIGGRGTRPPVEISAGNVPPEISFFYTNQNFAFSNIFKIKWPKSEEKLNFGVGGFRCL